jgi:hypothetical protein
MRRIEEAEAMAARLGTWLMSLAAAGGVVGGGSVALSAASAPAVASHPLPAPTPAQPDGLAGLRAQVLTLLAQDHALSQSLAKAKARLASEVATSESSLNRVRQQLAAAQTALAEARLLATSTIAAPSSAGSATASTAPATHGSTGASGAGTGGTSGSGSDSGATGGHDD